MFSFVKKLFQRKEPNAAFDGRNPCCEIPLGIHARCQLNVTPPTAHEDELTMSGVLFDSDNPKYADRLTPAQRRLCAQAWDCAVMQRRRADATQFMVYVYWDSQGDLDWCFTSNPEEFEEKHDCCMAIFSTGKIIFFDRRFEDEVLRFRREGK